VEAGYAQVLHAARMGILRQLGFCLHTRYLNESAMNTS
jgi:hypothetical protein